jgi:hypothetical protein
MAMRQSLLRRSAAQPELRSSRGAAWSGASRSSAARSRTALAVATLALVLAACRRTTAQELTKATSTPAEHFTFALPPDDAPTELRGEGSERLRAPFGAAVERSAAGVVRVWQGQDFAIEIRFQALAPAALEALVQGSERVLQENDLSVFKSGQGYWFVSSRELVPEWDENERRTLTCSSAGALASQPGNASKRRSFSRAAIEHMVAACRTLELPRLD